jgi:hypothetical protein
MPRGFGRLPFIGRLSTRGERSPNDLAVAIQRPVDPDLAPIGPPVLLPSAIIRQVLFEPTELVPIWAKPRAEPVQATPPRTEPKATKRPRRPRATGTTAAKATTPSLATTPVTAAKPRSRTRKRNV